MTSLPFVPSQLRGFQNVNKHCVVSSKYPCEHLLSLLFQLNSVIRGRGKSDMHLLDAENASKLKANTMPKAPTRRPDAERTWPGPNLEPT